MKEKKYNLFIADTKQEAPNAKFSYVGSGGYLLVISEDKPNNEFRLVPPENEERLQADEITWLTRCKIRINAEHVKERQEEYIGLLDKFFDELGKEIKKENKAGGKSK